MKGITPFLWFNTEAEEAARLYVSIFPNSKIGKAARYGDAGPGPKGSVMTIEFELDGQQFIALNGGPSHRFTEAVSFVVSCETQAEVDHYWSKLLANGGREDMCAWLKDRFGLSWQIVPTALPRLLGSSEPGVAPRVMQAMLNMKKIDIAALERAAAGK